MRRRRSPVATALVGAAALAVGLGAGWASTAGNAMPSTNRLSATTIGVSPADLAPSACTGTISAIVDVPAGGSYFSTATANVLLLGTSGNDNVQTSNGYACFVGGGPEPGNGDQITADKSSGSECVVAASARSNRMKNCTIVQSLP